MTEERQLPLFSLLTEGLSLPPRTASAVLDFTHKVEAGSLSVVGVYLYGSAARAAYRPAASDVDVLVVLRSSCPEEIVPKLVQAQDEARKSDARLDVIFATLEQVQSNEPPIPLDLVLPADAKPQRSPGNRGMMFPLDRQDVCDCGIALAGPRTCELVPPVPRAMLHEALAWLFPYLAGYFKNPELMLCRVAHAFPEGRLCSKSEAGRWALGVLGERWRELIEKALGERERGGTQAVCAPEELHSFQLACADVIKSATGVYV